MDKRQSNIARFMEMEEEYNLFSRVCGNIFYWQYIRFAIYMKIEDKINKNKPTVLKRNFTNLSITELKMLFGNLTFNNPMKIIKEKPLLVLSHSRRVKVNEENICIYTNFVKEEFMDMANFCEFPYALSHKYPIKSEYFLDSLIMTTKFSGILNKKFNKKMKKSVSDEASYLFNILKKYVSDVLSLDDLETIIMSRVSIYEKLKKNSREFLIKANPKVLLLTVSYDFYKMVFMETAKELGIQTVELQHGVMGKGHLAYNFCKKREYSFFPDNLLIFSDYWKKTTSIPLKENAIITTGFPYLEENLGALLTNTKPNGSNLKKVVCISQPEFSNKFLHMLCDYFEKYEVDQCEFIIRLHPAEIISKELEEKLTSFAAVKLDKGEYSLYELFSKSNVQIGVTSTAIFEGLAFNLKTYIYHIEKTDDYMGDLVNNGYAKMFDNTQDLDYLLKTEDSLVTKKGDFWAFNSKSKITDFLYQKLK